MPKKEIDIEKRIENIDVDMVALAKKIEAKTKLINKHNTEWGDMREEYRGLKTKREYLIEMGNE